MRLFQSSSFRNKELMVWMSSALVPSLKWHLQEVFVVTVASHHRVPDLLSLFDEHTDSARVLKLL